MSEAFLRTAAEHGEREAVADADDTWTYGELADATRRLARALRDSGVRRGDRVAIVAERTASLPLALLGVLTAGAAFVIVDATSSTAPRVVERVSPRHVLCVTRDRAAPGGSGVDAVHHGRRSLRLGTAAEVRAVLAAFPPDRTPAPVGREDLAYVAFAAGAPKGVLGRHGPLARFQPWRSSAFELSAEDHFVLLADLEHERLPQELLEPLLLGASLHVPSAAMLGDAQRLAELLAERAVSVLHLTPERARSLAAGGARLPGLRRVFLPFGGEPLRGALVRALRGAAPEALLVAEYGAAEAQQAVAFEVLRDDPPDSGPVRIGRGAPGVELVVLTRDDELAPVAEVGAVAFRSAHLARGYLDDPALTADRFRPSASNDPAAPAERVFRTGHLGRFTPDGAVELVPPEADVNAPAARAPAALLPSRP